MNGLTDNNRQSGAAMAHGVEKKSWLSHLPGILGGSAALLAAVTTVYVNMHGGRNNVTVSMPAPAQAAPAPVAAATAATNSKLAGDRVDLRLDRLLVRNDGSLGTTDWTFEVDVDGAPQFTLPMKALSDREGENLVKPASADQANADLEVPDNRNLPVVVKGWKRAWLAGRSLPDIQGSGWLSRGVTSVVVNAKSDKPKGPEFVMYFSAAALPDGRR